MKRDAESISNLSKEARAKLQRVFQDFEAEQTSALRKINQDVQDMNRDILAMRRKIIGISIVALTVLMLIVLARLF